MNADSNSDGKISMVEAFNYALMKDSADENPQYEDNGDGVSRNVPIPFGGDGTFGETAFL